MKENTTPGQSDLGRIYFIAALHLILELWGTDGANFVKVHRLLRCALSWSDPSAPSHDRILLAGQDMIDSLGTGSLWSNLNHLIIANVDDLCFLPYSWCADIIKVLMAHSLSQTWKSYCDRSEWVVQRENCKFIRSLLVSHPIHRSRVQERWGRQELAFYSVCSKLMTQCQSMSFYSPVRM